MQPAEANVETSASVERLRVAALEVPTSGPESDDTLAWDATTMVLVEAAAGGTEGLGYRDVARAGDRVPDVKEFEPAASKALGSTPSRSAS